MSLVICDTNIFISLFRGMPETLNTLKVIGDKNVLMPSITAMELYRGMENKRELKLMEKRLSNYNVIHINQEASEIATNLILTFKLSHNLQIPDALIGAMSIAYKIPLFTYNKKDFMYMPNIALH